MQILEYKKQSYAAANYRSIKLVPDAIRIVPNKKISYLKI
jgi:hypothetical protein